MRSYYASSLQLLIYACLYIGSGGSTPVMDEPTYHEEESQEVRMCYFLLNILRNRAQMTDEL